MTTLIYNAAMRHGATRFGLKTLARAATILMLAGASALQAGCFATEPDVKAALQVTEDVSGWFDAGIVNGQNKLVPEIAFRVKNVADRAVTNVSFNVVFKVVSDTQELGAAYLQGIDSKGLGPGQMSPEFVGRSQLGYTSQEPRVQMLQHTQFKDVEVEIFAKHGPANWVSLGKFTVKRQLITQ
jgi:hypothetical protein